MNKNENHLGYAYILTNRGNSVLYVGATTNLVKRVYAHRHQYLNGFTKRYNLYKLVYYEVFDAIGAARLREKTIKEWLREKKRSLVESKNPDWSDLYNILRRDPSLADDRSG